MKTASDYNQEGVELASGGDTVAAEARYRKAIEINPAWSVPWYNLGLLYKGQRRWDEAFDSNKRAASLDRSDEAAWWNLGIAATACGKWKDARVAWTAVGISMPPGIGLPHMDLGLIPIRINPDGDAEVVWCNRIDPARAVIKSVPLPQSNRRYGDLLLHDGTANGYRLVGDKELPVLDELQLLAESEFGTYRIRVVAGEADATALIERAEEAGLAGEDWSSLRFLCKECSEGKPYGQHQHLAPDEGPERGIGIAATCRQEVQDLASEWIQTRPDCEVIDIECMIEPVSVQ
ncbi:MAG TPA: tetratricopeptide repeat protein [Blastocatellia bacterium]|nr:tetratricopeptide repeat protein [Blastocatellia bacterium]